MDIEKLKNAGFIETVYPGQDGVFSKKLLKASDMPNVAEHNWVPAEDDVAA